VNRRTFIRGACLLAALLAAAPVAQAQVTRYVHFQQGNAEGWGVLEGETIQRLSGAPWAGGTRTGQSVALSAVTLLAPTTPRTAVVVNVNYPSGVPRNQAGEPQERDHPTIITLPPRAFVGNGAPIMRPVEVENLRAEPTAAVIIGRTATSISPAEAGQYIFGVAPAVDVTAMDWRTGQWTRSKGTDSFKPVGPVVVSGVDYNNLTIVGKHNGTAMQPVRTSEMIWDFNELVSYVSQYMTLNPGDIVLAGTAGQTFTVALQAGDTFEVEIAGVGTLRNPVQAAPAMATLPPRFQRQQQQ
jgi:2-keto-4-pentenoate hydratase/2-oxohepta-3-ene-1,7-dioic acid hydratase in catechol pathway